MYRCVVYGTQIESDQPLFSDPYSGPHAITSRAALKFLKCPDITHFQGLDIGRRFQSSHGRELILYSDREFAQSIKGQRWSFNVKDVVSFYWVSGQRTIYYEIQNEANKDLLTFWFVHIFLPIYFTLEEIYDFLHAGAVEIDEKPVLFIAPSMSGKSTLTDYFIKQDHGLISDDKVPSYIENDQFFAVPSHPYHRPYRRFEDLGYRVDKQFGHVRPIHAIYALGRDDGTAKIEITEIVGFKKFETLLPNYLFSFNYLRAQRLKYLAELVSKIPIYSVTRPWDLDHLADVYHSIVHHSRQLADAN